MIKVEDWITEDIKRLRKIPQKSPDEHAYLKLLVQYNVMVQQFNAKIQKVKK
ncbi:hypothetical protein D3C76_705290 [compost metagenome]